MLPDPEKSGTYSSLRMVPPGECTFYFSFDEKKLLADDMPNCVTTEIENFTVPKTNIIENIIQKNALITETYMASMKCTPRPPPKYMAGNKRLKTPWDYFKSVFRTYKPDNQKILNRCFEVDWDNTKIGKIIKNGDELVKVKRYLKKNYKSFRETYKYYSAVAPIGIVVSIGTNTLSDVVSNCHEVINNENFKLSDLDFEFVATKAGLIKSKFNPDRQLVRHEFIEIFVRIAITKYFKSKLVDSISEAVIKLYEENLKPMFSLFDCHKWRAQKLWNEECDLTLRRHLNVLNNIYKKYIGRYALPGTPKYMSCDEFFDLICACGVVDDNFGQREISVLFNLAMMTQKNELESDKHLNMIFVEFMEATARVADKLNLPPLVDESEERDPNERLHANLSRRIKKPYPGLSLNYKIETLIYLMAKSCLKKNDLEAMERGVLKYYDEKKRLPKAKKYGISSKKY